MVGTSKILTVSYGTFSCTLEGFDDSFNTMKAIAEYFRGLAADDRYFGAEPPTPDAELLAKIAEREIARRVDARMDDGEIILRAAELSDQSGDALPSPEHTPAAEHDTASRAKVDADRKAAKAARKAEKQAAKAARKAQKAAAEEAERAKAEAEAATKTAADENAKAAAEAKTQADDDQNANAEHAAASHDDADTDILNSVSAATADATEGTTESNVEETRDTAPSSMLAAADSAPENTAPENAAPTAQAAPSQPDANSVAAKLQRIRAAVGTSNADADESLTAQVLPDTETPDVADVVVDEAPTPEEQPADTSDSTQGSPDMISRIMARQSEAPVQDDTAHDDASVETDVTIDANAQAEPPRARVVRMKRADFEKAVQDAQSDTDKPAAGPDFALLDGADELDDYLEDSDFTDQAAAITDTAFADDLKAITEDDADLSDEAASNAIENVTDALAAETTDIIDAEEDARADSIAADSTSPAASFLSEEPNVDDGALDRLMTESDEKMNEPEGSRRRDAIAQLKAAVAAKEAARQVGEPEDDGQDVENAFRNDLSEAVKPAETGATPRPRPVVRGATRTERPSAAPLKLVAAQRVDLPETTQRDGPVMPRRVAARKTEQPTTQGTGSFAEFADNMGATELPDLLEAAAAYTSFVEGADEFSRPQILRRVRAVASDDFNREDGLRSFADLLRAGRFTKVRNGRFQVADDSRFNPERAAS